MHGSETVRVGREVGMQTYALAGLFQDRLVGIVGIICPCSNTKSGDLPPTPSLPYPPNTGMEVWVMWFSLVCRPWMQSIPPPLVAMASSTKPQKKGNIARTTDEQYNTTLHGVCVRLQLNPLIYTPLPTAQLPASEGCNLFGPILVVSTSNGVSGLWLHLSEGMSPALVSDLSICCLGPLCCDCC